MIRPNYKEIFIKELQEFIKKTKENLDNYTFEVFGTSQLNLNNPKDPIQKMLIKGNIANATLLTANSTPSDKTLEEIIKSVQEPHTVKALNCEHVLAPYYKERCDRANDLIKFLNFDLETCIKYRYAYDYFSVLSEWLLNSNLYAKEQFRILFEVLEKNIKSGVYTEIGTIIDYYTLENYDFKTIEPKLLKKIIEAFLRFDKESIERLELTLTPEQDKEFDEAILSSETINPDTEPHIQIKENYFDLNVLTEENISKVLEALEKLRFNKKLISCIKNLLIKLNEIEGKKIIKPVPLKKETSHENLFKPTISIGSVTPKVNPLIFELKEYIDIDTCFPKRFLTLKERANTVARMLNVNYKKEDIQTFLTACINNQYSKDNIPGVSLETLFEDEATYQELQTYATEWGVEKDLGNIKDTLDYYREVVQEVSNREKEISKIENPYEKKRLMKELANEKSGANDLYKEFEKSLKKLINDYIMTTAQKILNPELQIVPSSMPKSKNLTHKSNN